MNETMDCGHERRFELEIPWEGDSGSTGVNIVCARCFAEELIDRNYGPLRREPLYRREQALMEALSDATDALRNHTLPVARSSRVVRIIERAEALLKSTVKVSKSA